MSKETEIYEERLAKAQKWRELKANPWGNGYRPEHLAGDITKRPREGHAGAAGGNPSPAISVAGRVVAVRSFGKAAFI